MASTTKRVTAAATLALVREGLVSLDEPLPELGEVRVFRRMDGRLDDTVPAERSATVREQLTFTFATSRRGA
ncbi:MAG: serine hydrolase [Acidimicrobiales bacterium]